jgi:MoaA/NifB/PqqE/SkfB family radical SAM enzyme
MNKNVPLTDYIFQFSDERKIPISATFELTSRCNFDCRMCYVHAMKSSNIKMPKDIYTKTWIQILNDAVDEGLLFLLFTGGEPLLRSDFIEIYTAAVTSGVICSINTNAYLINNSHIELFKKYPPARINITLYGTCNETYEKICGVKNGYSVVSKNIEMLIKSGISVSLNFTITKDNYDERLKLAEFANNNKLPFKPGTYIFAPAQGNCMTCRVDPILAAKASVEYYAVQHSKEEFLVHAVGVKALVDKGKKSPLRYPKSGVTCRSGSSAYWIHSDGKVGFCGMLESSADANVLEKSIKECWNIVVADAESKKPVEACTLCEYRFACKSCYAMKKRENETEEQIENSYSCRYNKAYIEEMMKIARGEDENEVL